MSDPCLPITLLLIAGACFVVAVLDHWRAERAEAERDRWRSRALRAESVAGCAFTVCADAERETQVALASVAALEARVKAMESPWTVRDVEDEPEPWSRPWESGQDAE